MIRRVLFVDDEPRVLDSLQLLLRGEDYDVVVAASANEAMQILERDHLSIVVSDDDMPGRRGTDFLTEVASRYPDVVLMMLTGRPTLGVTVELINSARIFRFLSKPCPPDTLRSYLNEGLREYELRVDTPYNHRQTETRLQISQTNHHGLSPRELEVVEHLVDGKRVSQLAKHLFISPHTVRNHLKHIFQKLDVHSQTELIDKFKR